VRGAGRAARVVLDGLAQAGQDLVQDQLVLGGNPQAVAVDDLQHTVFNEQRTFAAQNIEQLLIILSTE